MVEGISMVRFTKQLIISGYHLVVEVLHVFTMLLQSLSGISSVLGIPVSFAAMPGNSGTSSKLESTLGVSEN